MLLWLALVQRSFTLLLVFIIQDAVPPEDLPHLRPFAMAKDAWHFVVSLYKGSTSIQHSNYEVVQYEADEFAMKEDEEPRVLFRRVTKLASHSEIMGARTRMTIGSSASSSKQ